MTDQPQAKPSTPAPAAPEVTATAEPRPFNQWLLEQRNGILHSELSERLQELTLAVMEHEKTGTLTLVIKIAPAETIDAAMVISDEVKSKVPEADRGASLFYGDTAGNLSRRDPRQPQLPFQDISRKAD